jgi:DNA repair protein RecO (recombination protein O)
VSTDRLYRTEGIVIRRRDQGEADRVLTLCTPLGKIEAIAKGARKVRSRKAGHVELFTRSNFVIARVRNSWDIVSQAETVESHALLRSDLLRGAYARYAIELLDGFFAQKEGDQTLLDLLDHALSRLCQSDDPNLVIRFYEQHLLRLAGFRPELNVCAGEHKERRPLQPCELAPDEERGNRRPFGFDPERGGALCPDCTAKHGARPEIATLSPNGLQFLQACQRGPYSQLWHQRVTPTVHAEVERVMQHYITYHLERGLKSGAFLQQLRHQNATSE